MTERIVLAAWKGPLRRRLEISRIGDEIEVLMYDGGGPAKLRMSYADYWGFLADQATGFRTNGRDPVTGEALCAAG
jgi:hypothetical protein